MKWKIEQGWNCELVSETGLKIPRFNVIQAQDSRSGKWIFLVSTTTAYTSHGGDGALNQIRVIDCETDAVLNADRFADFVIEVPPHYAFLVK